MLHMLKKYGVATVVTRGVDGNGRDLTVHESAKEKIVSLVEKAELCCSVKSECGQLINILFHIRDNEDNPAWANQFGNFWLEPSVFRGPQIHDMDLDSVNIDSLLRAVRNEERFEFSRECNTGICLSPAISNEVVLWAKSKVKATSLKWEELGLPPIISQQYLVRIDSRSGMVVLSSPAWPKEVSFGGVPAIQDYAGEHPELPQRIINELLARDAGFAHCEQERFGWRIFDKADSQGVFAQTEDGAWAAAAAEAIRKHQDYEKEISLDAEAAVDDDEPESPRP